MLRGLDGTNPVRVEGNTDNVPISGHYRNNWELSTARAVTVVTVLAADGFDPKRLSAAGYADQRPIATNATVEGRALNRRVEIIVVRQASAAEAQPADESDAVPQGIDLGIARPVTNTAGSPERCSSRTRLGARAWTYATWSGRRRARWRSRSRAAGRLARRPVALSPASGSHETTSRSQSASRAVTI